MSVPNPDLLRQKKTEILNQLTAAIREGDEAKMTQSMAEFGEFTREQVLSEARGVLDSVDSAVLAGRGVRQLTSAEQRYYTQFITAAKSPDVKQSIDGIEAAFPETIVDAVMEDIRSEHPLLDAIDFVNTGALTKYLYNKQGTQLAVWGKLTSKIAAEMEGSIGVIDLTACKNTAYMCVSNDLLDLGPQWVDRYVRAVLVDALAASVETAVVSGTGNDCPIGMNRSVADDVTVTGGVYPEKTPVALTEITPASYGAILAPMAISPSGKARPVTGVILVCNPFDYLSKIMPATTVMAPDGTYRNDVLPYPTTVIPSVGIEQGKAVIGMAKRYFMGVGLGKRGRLETDDSVKFLDDQRAYKIKLLGNGRPKDNNAFTLLDISALKSAVYTVQLTGGTAQTPAAQGGGSGNG
jgi:hypothetical protein